MIRPKNIIVMALIQLLLAQVLSLPGLFLSVQPRSRALTSHINNEPLLSDFDGDEKPDIVELRDWGKSKKLQIRFANQRVASLDISNFNPAAGRFLIADIDYDRDFEIVWLPLNRTHTPHIWNVDRQGNFAHYKADKADTLRLLTQLSPTDTPETLEKKAAQSYSMIPAPRAPDHLVSTVTLLLPLRTTSVHLSDFVPATPANSYLAISHTRAPPQLA